MNTEYRDFFKHLRALLQSGAITYDQGKELASSVIDEMNRKGKEMAKKYGKRFVPFNFSSLIR